MAFVGAYMKEGAAIQEKGFLFGYNNIVWIVVANQVRFTNYLIDAVFLIASKLLYQIWPPKVFFCTATFILFESRLDRYPNIFKKRNDKGPSLLVFIAVSFLKITKKIVNSNDLRSLQSLLFKIF